MRGHTLSHKRDKKLWFFGGGLEKGEKTRFVLVLRSWSSSPGVAVAGMCVGSACLLVRAYILGLSTKAFNKEGR